VAYPAYPIKTLTQLQPILQGFRKAARLSQTAMAERLGITQQSYAHFEANPTLASVERLFRVLRILDAEISLAKIDSAPDSGHAVAEASGIAIKAQQESW
jgi:HTH-type transcriptional regulator/antitoxin HipB